MDPVKFYFFSLSPPARFNLLTIKYLKLNVEIIIVNLRNKEQFSQEFLKLNPQHTVPAIDDNGFILWESRAIATYLVSSKAPGNSLYPTDVKKRALVNNRLYLDHELQMAFLGMVYPVYSMGGKEVSKSQKEKMYKALGNLNTFLEGQKYVAGSELTLADLALLATVVSIQEMGANVKKFNNITAWLKTLESVPGAQENLEGAQLFANFIKSMIDLKQTWDD
ncbi:glutathione S-transferase D7-like [Phlebotomus argentipes]|uniref:glutathione S-transferase D7-like n=1 Tax=Phlebotomus argentipes TaxID=94469 RepID=UPI0028935FF2|nr:glutathione S-transferase D7-like [Phlebotomus argentipes]